MRDEIRRTALEIRDPHRHLDKEPEQADEDLERQDHLELPARNTLKAKLQQLLRVARR